MTILFYAFPILALVLAVLPWLMELRRRPVGAGARHKAQGEFVTLSDGVTHYRWHGGANGPILILIHGLTAPSWVFGGLVRGLTAMGFRVLSYDLYGRGLSDRPREEGTRHLFLRQLRELMAALKIDEPVTLMGYSMGGAISTILAAEEPDMVDRLVLLAPAGIDYNPAPLLDLAGRWGVWGDWLWGLLGGWALHRAVRSEKHRPTAIPNLPARMSREIGTRGYLRSVLSAQRHMLGEVLETEHREIAALYVAVVSVWGHDDPVIPLSALGRLTEWNRDAYKFVVEGAGHGLVYTNPKEVLDAIRENLREV